MAYNSRTEYPSRSVYFHHTSLFRSTYQRYDQHVNSSASFLLLLPPEIFDAGTRRHASHVIKDKTDRVCFVISTINIIINSIQKLFYRMHTSSVCRFLWFFYTRESRIHVTLCLSVEAITKGVYAPPGRR